MAGRFSVNTVFRATDRVTAPIRKMGARLNRFISAADRSFKRLNRTVNNLNRSLAETARTAGRRLAVGITAVGSALGFVAVQASKVEDSVAAFTPLLRGADNARKAVELLNETAATTPFQFEQLSQSANMLLGFGVSTLDDLIPTLRMLGDTAGGNAVRLNGITLAFSQIQAAGKASMQDVNQLINNGVPILGELADMWGVTVGQARALTSAGRATGEEVTKAFKRMTQEGGRFFRGMEIASQTQRGLLSTLRDNINLTAAFIGDKLLPITKAWTRSAIEAAKGVREWVENNEALLQQRMADALAFLTTNAGNFLDIGKGVLQLLGAWLAVTLLVKTATLAWNTALVLLKTTMFLLSIPLKVVAGLTLLWTAGIKAATAVAVIFGGIVKGLRVAVLSLGLAMALGTLPIGVIAAAIAGLVAAGTLLIANWDSVKDTVSSVWESIKDTFAKGFEAIKPVLDAITQPFELIFRGGSAILDSLGGLDGIFGGGTTGQAGVSDGVVSPQERTARTIQETLTSSTAEVTIRDETDSAEVTSGTMPSGVKLEQAGAF